MNLGELLTDGGLWLAILVSLAAGIVSFVSPCVLPLVPGYLALVGGSTSAATAATKGSGRAHMRGIAGQARMVWGVVLFVLGFSAVFIAFLTLVGTFATWVLRWQDLILRVMGVLIMFLGLVFVGWIRPLQTTARARPRGAVSLVGAPLLGAAFAVGWTPCIGPTLGLIMGMSLDQGSAGRGLILGIAYCVGLGLPFVLIALGFGWAATATRWVRRHLRAINIAGGILLLLIGFAMITGVWMQLTSALQTLVQGWATPL